MLSRLLVFTLTGLLFFVSAAQAETGQTDRVYKRVIKTQTINCGYAEWPPFFAINPNTKQMSGFMYDVWELIGKKLDLKINWNSLLGWGEVNEAVNGNKVDIFCVGVWPDAGRIKNLLLSRPVFYNSLYLYGRVGDTRFDNNYDALNQPSATLVGQESDVSSLILEMKFPRAKIDRLSPMSQQADWALNVITKKGDATLFDVPFAEDYMKNNPGKIRQIKGAPIAMMPVALPLAVGEYQLKNMIDVALNDLINDGTIAALIKKHEAKETYFPEPDVRLPKAEPQSRD